MHTQPDGSILYLSRKHVEYICRELDSVEIMREVFQLHGSGQTVLPDEAYLAWTNSQGENARSLNMPGYVGGNLHAVGTKIINGNISNPRRGLPRASGLTLLYDTISGQVSCIMEAAYISSLRTASVTALAVDLCQGPVIECVAVIGAGVLATTHIELLAQRLPQLQSILLFDIDRDRAYALQARLEPLLQARRIQLKPTHSAEEAVQAAQLIVPTTTTTTGYISYDWLQKGAILVNISLDDALPDVVLHADKVIVDDWNLVKNDPRRLLGRMYRQGDIVGPNDETPSHNQSARQVDAEMGDIVCGRQVGRQSNDDIILVNPFGLSIEDIALATHVYQQARALEIGTFLER